MIFLLHKNTNLLVRVSSFSDTDMAEWTKVAATVENSIVDSGWDMMDMSIVVVDVGRVVKSIMDVESERHRAHCFVLCHGSCGYYLLYHVCYYLATSGATGKSKSRCINVRGGEGRVVNGVDCLFHYGCLF